MRSGTDDRPPSATLSGEGKPECRAGTELGLHGNRSIVSLDERFDNGKTQAQPLLFLGIGLMLVKHGQEAVLRYPLAVVVDKAFGGAGVARLPRADDDLPARRVGMALAIRFWNTRRSRLASA